MNARRHPPCGASLGRAGWPVTLLPRKTIDPGANAGLAFKSASGGLVTEIRGYRVRVPPFFSNLLPEGHLRSYLAARIGVNPEREFLLLHALGADLPGAVTVASMDAEASARNDRRPREASDDGSARAPLRFSLAGVQLKFSAVMEAAGGLTIPADGIGGSWIVKLPSARFPAVPQNEFVTMGLARGIGIPVPRTDWCPFTRSSACRTMWPRWATTPSRSSDSTAVRGGAESTWRTSRRYSACIPSASTDGAVTPASPPCCRPRQGRRRSKTSSAAWHSRC